MKKQFYLFFCVCISISAFTQNNADSVVVIPKHASIIYVKPVSFDSLISVLQRQEFKIDQLVKNNTIVTGYRMFGGFFNQISLHIRYYDSTAEIIGTIYNRSSGSGNMDYVVTYSGMSKKAFAIMNNFALALKGKLYYEK